MAAQQHDQPSNLDHALAYARRGWRVIPIPPGLKFPQGYPAWQRDGSTDEAKIRHWWGLAPDHGIGIVTGATSGIWVLDIDVSDGKAGDETLRDLEEAYGPLPDTYSVQTGSGGIHYYFAWPVDQVITNSASGALGPGIDVRGEGGFVVAPPSLHANGRRYAEILSTGHVEHAPGWMLAMLEPPAPEPRQQASTPAGDRPGDLWAASTTWAQILEPDGWTLHHVDHTGEEHWTRPGKERRDGTSATTGYKGSDILKVFTSSLIPSGLQPDATYSKIGYLAATRHAGDHSAAARSLREQGWHGAPPPAFGDLLGASLTADGTETPQDGQEPAERADWAPMPLDDVLAGGSEPPTPTILAPPGGTALLYPGRVNSMFGESGVGKTWIELAAIASVITEGGTAMLIDLEDTPHGITSRLRLLGISDVQICEQFLYVSPQTGWSPAAQATMATVLASRTVDLVCIDSTGEAMAAGGVKGNDDDDVARWFVNFPKFIARRGPAVLIIDHIPKDPNAPSGYAIGSQRKLAAVDGAAYRVESIKVPSRVDDGLLKVIVAKDRHGNHTKGRTAATVAVNHVAGQVAITLSTDTSPVDEEGKFRPTAIMERVSLLLEDHPGLSRRQIESQTSGKSSTIRKAIDVLFQEGWIDFAPGTSQGACFEVLRPYRDEQFQAVDNPAGGASTEPAEGAEMARDGKNASPASPPRPSGGDALGSEARPPRPPPTGRGRAEPVEKDAEKGGARPPASPEDDDPWNLGLDEDDEPTPEEIQ